MIQIVKCLSENLEQGYFKPCKIFTEERYKALFRPRLNCRHDEHQNQSELATNNIHTQTDPSQFHADKSQMTEDFDTQDEDPTISIETTISFVIETSQMGEVEQPTGGTELDGLQALQKPYVKVVSNAKPNNSNKNIKSTRLKSNYKSNGTFYDKLKSYFF